MLKYFLLGRHWRACLFCLVWSLASSTPVWSLCFIGRIYRLIYALKVVYTVWSHKRAQYPWRRSYIHGFVISLPQPAVTILIQFSGFSSLSFPCQCLQRVLSGLVLRMKPPSDTPVLLPDYSSLSVFLFSVIRVLSSVLGSWLLHLCWFYPNSI